MYAADSFAYGIDFNDLDEIVRSITDGADGVNFLTHCDTCSNSKTRSVEEDFLTQSDLSSNSTTVPVEKKILLTSNFLSVEIESAKPIKRISSKSVSAEDFLTALKDDDASSSHDIALRLLAKYDAMSDSDEKCNLRVFLTEVARDVVRIAQNALQRDYVLLWQAYVFYIKMVRHASDSFFISYSQQAFNLAEVHGDGVRTAFVAELFLDKLTESFRDFIALKVIADELHHDGCLRLKQTVTHLWGGRHRLLPIPIPIPTPTTPPPPSYHDALEALGGSSDSVKDSEQRS
jgi:hypothetical protein